MKTNNINEEILIDYIEGNLTGAETEALELLLEKNPELQKEVGFLKKSILVPDENITLPAKNTYKRKAITLYPFLYSAASIAALIIVGLFFLKPQTPDNGDILITGIDQPLPSLTDENLPQPAVIPDIQELPVEEDPSSTIQIALNDDLNHSSLPEEPGKNLSPITKLVDPGRELISIEPELPELESPAVDMATMAFPVRQLPETLWDAYPEFALESTNEERSKVRKILDSFLQVKKEDENGDPVYVIHLNTGSMNLKGVFSFNQF